MHSIFPTKRKTIHRMERLPCELLHHILQCIDQPLDLFRMSCVCSRWRSFIMNDEHFLNQWFLRSLENSQESFQDCLPYLREAHKLKLLSDIDQSLFPVNLRSNEWCVLPWPFPRYPSCNKDVSVYYYPISLFHSSHSFSFWLFLPYQCNFNIHITNSRVEDVSIWFCGDKLHYDNKGKHILIADRWIHVTISKIDLQSDYQIYIDGQYLSKDILHDICLIETRVNCIVSQNMLVFRTHYKTPSKIRIANFVAFKRCLTLFEIRAIVKQQTSIKQVKAGTYINNNKLHNSNII